MRQDPAERYKMTLALSFFQEAVTQKNGAKEKSKVK
jgi:hypothetical protein